MSDAATIDELRTELARLARAARQLVAGEREGGVVTLPGTPRPAASDPAPEPPEPPQHDEPKAGAAPAVARKDAPAPRVRATRAPPAEPGPTPFRPRVRPLDLDESALVPFGDLPARVEACRRCSLGSSRTCSVFGEGSPTADLVFCGEAPGLDEDRSGRPFVGAAGQLLSAMIERGMKLRREDVYVLNTLKCRPPRNRAPQPIEVAACRPFLEEQLAVLRPRVIVALGNHAVRALLGESPPISSIRGQVIPALGTRVVPTFHPAYLLRNPAAKRETWQDLQTVMALLAEGNEGAD